MFYTKLCLFHTFLGGWLAGLIENIVNSAKALAMAWAELDNYKKEIIQKIQNNKKIQKTKYNSY